MIRVTPNKYSYRLPVTFVLLAFFLFAPLAHAKDRDLQWYRDHGVTVAGLEKASPLSFIGYDGNPKGFVVDIWEMWSRKTGIPVKFRLTDWPTTLELVKNGVCDIHSGLFYNEERAEFLDFGAPLNRMKAALMVLRKNDADADVIFKKYTIGVLHKGYSEYFMKKNHPESKLIPIDTNSGLAKALVNKDIMAIAGDHPIVGYEASKLGASKDLLVKKILYEQDLYAAVAKGRTELLDIVNQGVTAITESERESIAKRWFVTEVSSTDWMWHIVIVVALLVSALLFLLVFDKRKTGLSSSDN